LQLIHIVGGKIKTGDIRALWTRALKTGVAGGATIRFKCNTVNNLGTATLIGTTTFALASTLSQEAHRFLSFRTGNILAVFPGATSGAYGNVSSGVAETTMSLDPSSDFYIWITIQLGSNLDSVVAASSFLN